MNPKYSDADNWLMHDPPEHTFEYNLESNMISLLYVTLDGKWGLPRMSEVAKTAAEFNRFGSTLEAMVSLSTVEWSGEKGRWTIE